MSTATNHSLAPILGGDRPMQNRRCRYAPANCIHISPSFMNGDLVQADVSGGDAVGEWLRRLSQAGWRLLRTARRSSNFEI